ncbi:hypothetical protein HaLaN_18830, partial [Haematococcus lacustris]
MVLHRTESVMLLWALACTREHSSITLPLIPLTLTQEVLPRLASLTGTEFQMCVRALGKLQHCPPEQELHQLLYEALARLPPRPSRVAPSPRVLDASGVALVAVAVAQMGPRPTTVTASWWNAWLPAVTASVTELSGPVLRSLIVALRDAVLPAVHSGPVLCGRRSEVLKLVRALEHHPLLVEQLRHPSGRQAPSHRPAAAGPPRPTPAAPQDKKEMERLDELQKLSMDFFDLKAAVAKEEQRPLAQLASLQPATPVIQPPLSAAGSPGGSAVSADSAATLMELK